jgi:protein-arginine kinase activator protein McsA
MNDDGSTPKDDEISDYDEDGDDEDEFDEMLMMIDSEPTRKVSIDDLEKIMNEAISNEEYEIAAEMRDRIQKLKEEK